MSLPAQPRASMRGMRAKVQCPGRRLHTAHSLLEQLRQGCPPQCLTLGQAANRARKLTRPNPSGLHRMTKVHSIPFE